MARGPWPRPPTSTPQSVGLWVRKAATAPLLRPVLAFVMHGPSGGLAGWGAASIYHGQFDLAGLQLPGRQTLKVRCQMRDNIPDHHINLQE